MKTRDKVVELHSLGKTDAEIAAMLTVSRQWVHSVRKRLGLVLNPKIKTSNKCPHCNVPISKQASACLPCHVKHRNNAKAGILQTEDIPKIKTMKGDGVAVTAIATHFGVKPVTIYAALQGRNWKRISK